MLRRVKNWLRDQHAYFQIRRRFANDSGFAAMSAVLRTIFRPSKTVLFYPEFPSRDSIYFKICATSGYAISTNVHGSFIAIIKWENATFFDAAELQKIPRGAGRILNAGSLDISKRVVARIFAEIFGYPLEINPLEFRGKIVEKSDSNATHDGRILEGPLKPDHIRADHVYQKAIDNTSDDLALDYRVPILGNNIPLVYLKYRPLESRFSNINSLVRLAEPAAVFSPAELEKIVSMARQMGMDCGEFDVLRDKDGRIYVVDTNNTPNGPPNGLPESDSKMAVTLLAAAFSKWVES